MISPQEALEIIKKNTFSATIESTNLHNSFNRVLAEDLFADRDFPPFDRVMMDGIAIQNTECKEWILEKTVFAGQEQTKLHDPNACIEIMTGSPLPVGCNAVIPKEEIEFIKSGDQIIAKFIGQNIAKSQFIHQKGADLRKESLLIARNTKITTLEIALAATIGKSKISVFQKPSIALISTGDELVPVDQVPLPHQIRSSNIPMLSATLEAKGFQTEQKHIPDSKELLQTEIEKSLHSNDVLILSGGVSAGKKDFIPDVLKDLGFDCHFHKIAQKPGKPIWFGTRKKDQKTIFALPGNPISTFICFNVYVMPFLEKQEIRLFETKVSNAKPNNKDLDFWLPAKWIQKGIEAEILPNNGSGDLVNWKEAEILVWQKAGQNSVYLPYIPVK